MSLLKSAIEGMAKKGKIEHEETIGDSLFVFRNLTMEEQLLVDSTSNLNTIKEKYKDKEINTFQDTLIKLRNLAILSYSIKEINGVPPVDESLSLEEQYKQRKEFRDELNELNPILIDQLMTKGYGNVFKKSQEFYKDIKENSGK